MELKKLEEVKGSLKSIKEAKDNIFRLAQLFSQTDDVAVEEVEEIHQRSQTDWTIKLKTSTMKIMHKKDPRRAFG